EEVFEGPAPHRLDCRIRAGCLRDKDHRDAGIDLADALVNLQTAHAGQDDVQENNVRLAPRNVANRLTPASDNFDLEAPWREDVADLLEDQLWLIVNKQQSR